MYNMQKIWVLCTGCGSSARNAFFGAKPIGYGGACPTCGSYWKDSQIIASTIGKTGSGVLGDIRVTDESKVRVIWLAT
jgi:hypothetical protein